MSYNTETNGENNLKPWAIVILQESNVLVMKWPLDKPTFDHRTHNIAIAATQNRSNIVRTQYRLAL